MSEFDEPAFRLGPVGQILLGVADLARAEAFYGGALGLTRLFEAEGQAVYDAGEIRIMLQVRADHETVRPGSPIHFRVHDIRRARRDLERRGVVFTEPVQLIAAFRDHNLWTTEFIDPDGHRLALMMEGPKGFAA